MVAVSLIVFSASKITHLGLLIVIFSRLLQWLNVWILIDITLSGIEMFVNEEQLSNANLPIDITLSGIEMFVNEVQ